MSEFISITMNLLEGFGYTVSLFFLTLICALPLGLLISFGSRSKHVWLSAPLHVFIWIIRGTPLMLQILVIYYGPALLFDIPSFDRFVAAVMAFVINYACYFSEIFRGGIGGISRGQSEAAQVLGLTRWQTFTKVILLQVIKNIMAPISNEIITLVKDTSLANIIAISEIIMVGKGIVAESGAIWPLFYTGVYFLIFNGILTLLFAYAEKKLKYYR